MDNRRTYPYKDFLSWMEESRVVADRRELLLSLAARVPDILDCIRSYETGAQDICAAALARVIDTDESQPLLWAWRKYQNLLSVKNHELLCRSGVQAQVRLEVLEWRRAKEQNDERALWEIARRLGN